MHIDPVGFAGGEGGGGDHVELVIADGLGDRVGGGVDGDLHLLIPELGFALFDLIVQAVRPAAQFQLLLAKLKRDNADEAGAEETN